MIILRKNYVILTLCIVSTILYGQAWYAQTSGTNSLLLDAYFNDPDTGWVVGITNTILHTTDGGTNWFDQNPSLLVNYYSVYFTDGQTGHAVGTTAGGSGRICHTTDGGSNWDTIPVASAYSLWSVFFIDANIGWIAGGQEVGLCIDPIRTVHYTVDGGYNWSTQFYQYDSFPLHDIHFIDSNTGCVVGENGVIFWTTDGGSNWVQKTSGTVQHLWGVFLLDANTAWAVGVRGTVLYTTNGGDIWVVQSADTTYGFGKVYFADANNGWISGGNNDNGIVLHTADGGNSWTTQYTGAATSLMSVYFTDADTGWAVGNLGTIIHTTTGGTGIIEDKSFIKDPARLTLAQNKPNPFSQNTEIRFSIPYSEHVTLEVYNIIGQNVATLVDNELEPGEYKVNFNAQKLPNGIYLYRLDAGNQVQIKRCTILR
jgi:photosystem II stability/assembly factor-like uncharacterized protein